ncbi:MAG: hypothetical protein WAL00_03550 [Exiguobacterium undae]
MPIRYFSRLSIGLLLLAAGCFYFGYVMTPYPHQSSGNGNPALLLIPLLPVLAIFTTITMARLFLHLAFRPIWLMVMTLLSGLYLIGGSLYQIIRYQAYQEELIRIVVENTNDFEYAESLTDAFSIFMNAQVFNFNTFFLYVCLIVILSSLTVGSKRLLSKLRF